MQCSKLPIKMLANCIFRMIRQIFDLPIIPCIRYIATFVYVHGLKHACSETIVLSTGSPAMKSPEYPHIGAVHTSMYRTSYIITLYVKYLLHN